MTRTKIEVRKAFSKEEKEFLKLKTSGKCGHCGTKLSEDNLSIDHIIPISKGGTNKEENLICLCSKCNKDKSDMVADPLYYYPYLKYEYEGDIIALFEKYIKTVDYVQRTNLMSVDILGNYISMEDRKVLKQKLKSIHSMQGVNISLDFRSFMSNLCQIQLRKAVYSDLDDVYTFMIKNLGYSNKDAYDRINIAFTRYSIYVYKMRGNIVGFFFLVPRRIAKDRNIMVVSIEELYIRYRKYIIEVINLLKGFCSFFLSRDTFSNQFVSVQSRDVEIIEILGSSIGSNIHKLKKASINDCYTIFFTKTAKSIFPFLYLDETEYQAWLHKLYCYKQDKMLSPLLNNSHFKEFGDKCNIFVSLKEPEDYFGKEVVF